LGVVGVSGGADSVALLRALRACDVPLAVAHVNHKLRGSDSDADEAFVRDLCAALGVECHVKAVDVAALAAGDNLEATARRVRYDFFAEVARATGAQWIATAHTADDQAETVLHRIVRGTGLQGLRGIAAERQPTPPAEEPNPPAPFPKTEGGAHAPNLPRAGLLSGSATAEPPPSLLGKGAGGLGSSLYRPLLAASRADVLAYLASINQSHREDGSNADTRFTRNRIRHELLPLLKSFNPDIVSALARLAEHATEAHEVITASATDLLAKAERPKAGATIVLDAATLCAAPRGVLRAALRVLWEREGWPMSAMTFDSWERAVEVADGNAPACDFPAGVSMRHAGRVVQLVRRE
jgi:tRNA(Ile)-lysidine synthase